MISIIHHFLVASAFSVATGQILPQEPNNLLTGTAGTTVETIRRTQAATPYVQMTRGTAAPDINTLAPAPSPTTDCCVCRNHPNNSWTSPECCIHSDSADVRGCAAPAENFWTCLRIFALCPVY